MRLTVVTGEWVFIACKWQWWSGLSWAQTLVFESRAHPANPHGPLCLPLSPTKGTQICWKPELWATQEGLCSRVIKTGLGLRSAQVHCSVHHTTWLLGKK